MNLLAALLKQGQGVMEREDWESRRRAESPSWNVLQLIHPMRDAGLARQGNWREFQHVVQEWLKLIVFGMSCSHARKSLSAIRQEIILEVSGPQPKMMIICDKHYHSQITHRCVWIETGSTKTTQGSYAIMFRAWFPGVGRITCLK